MKRKIFSSSAAIAILAGSLIVGCGGGGDDGGINTIETEIEIIPNPDTNYTEVPDINFTGTKLACDPVSYTSNDAGNFSDQDKNVTNVSYDKKEENRLRATNNNTLKRMSGVEVNATSRNGDPVDLGSESNLTHPLIVSYQQEVVGDKYELGDGSADIPDPYQRDALFVGVSYDNGATWKNTKLSDSDGESSITVNWNDADIPYGGHVSKPTMAVQGKNILVAYNDKYCPKNDPLGVTKDLDYFQAVGEQGTIDYGGVHIEFNDKYVYEAPFSCVWTVRGEFVDDLDPSTQEVDGPEFGIRWHKPEQLTSGMRDSNHLRIAAAKDAGFALAWHEDTEGLRAGKAKGPGEGWSGATTNHGTDIWYTAITWNDFNKSNSTIVDGKEMNITSAIPFNYPVRITDNETCAASAAEGDFNSTDTKLYCEPLCNTGKAAVITKKNGVTDTTIWRCTTTEYDWLLMDNAEDETNDTRVILDGDTGASRPTLNILKTNADEFVVLLGYEETKGLSERNTSESRNDEPGVNITDIENEGKSVYFESFNFDAFFEFNVSTAVESNPFATIAMPLVSSGDILNIRVPEATDSYNYDPLDPEATTGDYIYENARRLVVGTQVDSCDADKYTFAVLYKQSFDTQGASSDMFVRVNEGFTYDDFIDLPSGYAVGDLNVTNVSAQIPHDYVNGLDYNETGPLWDGDGLNLDDQTYENSDENTYSPRIFLRGNDIYTGFAYTPEDNKTVNGNMPTNFHTNIYWNGTWLGVDNVSKITKGNITSEDPRFIPTPKAVAGTIPSDASNPNILWVAWGTINTDPEIDAPEGIYFKRAEYNESEPKKFTWSEEQNLSDRFGAEIQEHAVQILSTPDGRTLHGVWIQESELMPAEVTEAERFYGLDTWHGRVDINTTIP